MVGWWRQRAQAVAYLEIFATGSVGGRTVQNPDGMNTEARAMKELAE